MSFRICQKIIALAGLAALTTHANPLRLEGKSARRAFDAMGDITPLKSTADGITLVVKRGENVSCEQRTEMSEEIKLVQYTCEVNLPKPRPVKWGQGVTFDGEAAKQAYESMPGSGFPTFAHGGDFSYAKDTEHLHCTYNTFFDGRVIYNCAIHLKGNGRVGEVRHADW